MLTPIKLGSDPNLKLSPRSNSSQKLNALDLHSNVPSIFSVGSGEHSTISPRTPRLDPLPASACSAIQQSLHESRRPSKDILKPLEDNRTISMKSNSPDTSNGTFRIISNAGSSKGTSSSPRKEYVNILQPLSPLQGALGNAVDNKGDMHCNILTFDRQDLCDVVAEEASCNKRMVPSLHLSSPLPIATSSKRTTEVLNALNAPSAIAFGGSKFPSSRTTRIERIESSRATCEALANKDGVILSADDNFATALGVTKSELIGTSIIHFAYFESPEDMMQASCTLSSLTKDQSWNAPLQHNRALDVVATVVLPTAPPNEAANKMMMMSTKTRKSKEQLQLSLVKVKSREYLQSPSITGINLGCQSNEFAPKPMTVLVVDDSISTVRLLESILTKAGYVVQTELSGVDALAKMKASPSSFDVVIVDVNMPILDGLQLCHEYRAFEAELQSKRESSSSTQQPPSIAPTPLNPDAGTRSATDNDNTADRASSTSLGSPITVTSEYSPQVIIANTGDFSATIIHEVMSAGFDGFLPKPFSIKQFRELLSALD